MVGKSIELSYHTARGELSVFSIIRHPLPVSFCTGCARLPSFGLFHHRAPQKDRKRLGKRACWPRRGVGRKRRIVLPENHAPTALRVAILAYEPREESKGYMNELYHLLSEAGHTPFFTP
jgi:hypothetical protein